MIRVELNGKPLNPQNLTETIMKAAMEKAAAHMHEKVNSIRHPVTGEFPTVVVFGTSLDDIEMRIEGSTELVALVKERLGITGSSDSELSAEQPGSPPKVFLSYAWEDSGLASQIAHVLQANGVDTWWAEWCISAGDSLRQKIEEGLGDCSHFVVLLTPNSIVKPWVNLEIDAGLMLKLQSKVKFIPLRHQLPAEQLPHLLRGMLSPSVENPAEDICQLINDIYGVTKKPALGKAPMAATRETNTGYSAAANMIAKVIVESTQCARKFDPWIGIDELVKLTGLSEDDVADAAHELRGMIGVHHEGTFYPEAELFATFDRFWMPWDPKVDALAMATDMVNDSEFPGSPEDIATRYGWDARRLNPAMAYLVNRKIARGLMTLNSGDWLVANIVRTDETRRFVKSHL